VSRPRPPARTRPEKVIPVLPRAQPAIDSPATLHSSRWPHRRPRFASRRGVTLLEVVAATALLAIVATAAFSVFAYIANVQLRDRQRLAAAELAGRLILQYLDDFREMPSPSQPIRYGPPGAETWFQWDMRVVPVEVSERISNPEKQEARRTRQASMNMNRLKQVRIRVWLAPESGGSYSPDGAAPEFTITRLMDPIQYRNPSSSSKLFSNPELSRKYLEDMFGYGGSNPTGQQPPGGNPK